jgi:hypothetical protein
MSDKNLHSKSSSKEKDKKQILRDIKNECILKSKKYKKKFKKYKRIDDFIDGTNALLNGVSISLIISGFGIPPLLVASAITSGVNFILSRFQDKINLKSKYTNHNLSINQYSNLSREILAVLTKNNLSSEEYHNYICEVTDKIALIEDSSLII